ncbi:glycosyl transferase [Serratia odorifera]|nr:glycosyl transferase [Serratia odorifera]
MVIKMTHKVLDIDLSKVEKILAPNILHFVWVGDLNKVNTHYIEIWRRTNKDKALFFWHDRNASLCNFLNSSIRDFINIKKIKYKDTLELKIKNEAFNFIFSKIKEGFSFDELVIKFLMKNGIPYQEQPKEIEESWFETRGLIKKDIAELFCNDVNGYNDFMKYYYYEVILRCNLASASDIARLLIIYQYGGVYIDIDTLPYIDNVYHKLNEYITREGVIENDRFLLFKTACILNRLDPEIISSKYMENYNNKALGVSVVRFDKIKELIGIDIANFSLDMILPLGNIYIYKNLLAVGALKRLKGVYFNNFISSHQKAKAVRIILRVMRKRYRFLEKNNCIFNHYIDDGFRCYLTRILTWRTELITKDYCVTSVLTGPGLIVEVLLGLAYDLLNIDHSVEPSFVAEYMQSTEFEIALFQHNIDTPDGTFSAWRK